MAKSLYGFIGDGLVSKGIIMLSIDIGEEPTVFYRYIGFLAIDNRSVYNGILRSPYLKRLKRITSIHHLCLKFKTPKWMARVRDNQVVTCKCYLSAYGNQS